ncbi:hypothetical protein ABZP36_006744 [Zizania latifolia]
MASVGGKGETVLVAGEIGSWLIRLLLDRGYTVHTGTAVLNPGGRDGPPLHVFPGDLLDAAALLAAARGCSSAFTSPPPAPWTASSTPGTPAALPTSVLPSASAHPPGRLPWLQRQLMVPAVVGTLNVLRAAKDAERMRRDVVTSSISAIVPNPVWPAGEVPDERY